MGPLVNAFAAALWRACSGERKYQLAHRFWLGIVDKSVETINKAL